MDIRLVTVREDFEKAYNILNSKEYPLSFYEYSLKHENFHKSEGLKLIGVFENDLCMGSISYRVISCIHLEKILEIKEIYQSSIKTYKVMMDFLDQLAREEDCRVIKICKNKPERLDHNFFDRFENYFRKLCANSFLQNSEKY